jgi:hypothetical protein
MVTLFGSMGWDLGKGIGSSQNEILGLGTLVLGLGTKSFVTRAHQLPIIILFIVPQGTLPLFGT